MSWIYTEHRNLPGRLKALHIALREVSVEVSRLTAALHDIEAGLHGAYDPTAAVLRRPPGAGITGDDVITWARVVELLEAVRDVPAPGDLEAIRQLYREVSERLERVAGPLHDPRLRLGMDIEGGAR